MKQHNNHPDLTLMLICDTSSNTTYLLSGRSTEYDIVVEVFSCKFEEVLCDSSIGGFCLDQRHFQQYIGAKIVIRGHLLRSTLYSEYYYFLTSLIVVI